MMVHIKKMKDETCYQDQAEPCWKKYPTYILIDISKFGTRSGDTYVPSLWQDRAGKCGPTAEAAEIFFYEIYA